MQYTTIATHVIDCTTTDGTHIAGSLPEYWRYHSEHSIWGMEGVTNHDLIGIKTHYMR